jgi:hypothetical protein
MALAILALLQTVAAWEEGTLFSIQEHQHNTTRRPLTFKDKQDVHDLIRVHHLTSKNAP